MIYNSQTLLHASPIKDMYNYKRRTHGVSHGLSEAGYDICLKQDIRFARSFDNIMYHTIDDKRHLGNFAIASAIEEFIMPNNLVGVVHDKSTWARQGLSVFNTVIEPGWEGFLTLELVYHGSEPLELPAGAGIAQVLFHETTCQVSYDGKYQNQEDRPVSAIFEKG